MNEMIFEFVSNLFLTDGLIIAVAAFIVGQILKNFEKINTDFIPLVGGVLGSVLGIFLLGIFADKDIITAAILGLALGWAATGGYETIKKLK